jgi:hypothetical protein
MADPKHKEHRDSTLRSTIIGGVCLIVGSLIPVVWDAYQRSQSERPDLRGSCALSFYAQIASLGVANVTFVQDSTAAIHQGLDAGGGPALLCRISNVGDPVAHDIQVAFKVDVHGGRNVDRFVEIGEIPGHDTREFAIVDAYSGTKQSGTQTAVRASRAR